MAQSHQQTQQTEITLPTDVESALFRVLRHYWNMEQGEHARQPEHARIGHIFESIRLLDDWLFRPTGLVVGRRTSS